MPEFDIEKLLSDLNEISTPFIETKKNPEELTEYVERFAGSEKSVATVCAFVGWNTAIYVIREIIKQRLTEEKASE